MPGISLGTQHTNMQHTWEVQTDSQYITDRQYSTDGSTAADAGTLTPTPTTTNTSQTRTHSRAWCSDGTHVYSTKHAPESHTNQIDDNIAIHTRSTTTASIAPHPHTALDIASTNNVLNCIVVTVVEPNFAAHNKRRRIASQTERIRRGGFQSCNVLPRMLPLSQALCEYIDKAWHARQGKCTV